MHAVTVFFALLLFLTLEAPVSYSQELSQKLFLMSPDDSDVIRLEKTQLGVLSARRAVLQGGGPVGGSAVRAVIEAKLDDPISSTQPGVVFNYAMRAFGLVTGEIVFKIAYGTDVGRFGWGATGLPRSFTGEGAYIVDTPTAAEFIRVMTMLQTSKDVHWVEPTVRYIPQGIE